MWKRLQIESGWIALEANSFSVFALLRVVHMVIREETSFSGRAYIELMISEDCTLKRTARTTLIEQASISKWSIKSK